MWLDYVRDSIHIRSVGGVLPEAARSLSLKALRLEVDTGVLSLREFRYVIPAVASAIDSTKSVDGSKPEWTSLAYNPDLEEISIDLVNGSDAAKVSVADLGLESHFAGLPIKFTWSPEPSAPSVNTWTDARYYGGARMLGDNNGVCTLGFHVWRGTARMAVTAAHCGMGDPGTWKGTGVFPAFGSMSRFLPNEIYDKGSVTAIALGTNCGSVTSTTPWTPVAHGPGWQAWSDAALTSMTNGLTQGRVWDPTHGYIRVRETVIPLLNDWVMKVRSEP